MCRKQVIAGVLVLFFGFGWSGMSAYAAEEEHQEAAEALIPETLPGIWQEVIESQEHLEETIAAGQLADVHKHAFRLRDLLQALPKVSAELSADTRQRLQESVDRVGEIAELLDSYGDSGDALNTKAQADRLEKLLEYIRTFYTEDAIDALHSKDDQKHIQ